MNADAALLAELHRLRRAVPGISGAVLASVDGLLVASDLSGVDPHHLAALSAASLGIGHRFADVVGHGSLRESVVQGTDGCVVSCPAGSNAILTVLVRPDADLSRLRTDTRPAAQRLGALWESLRQRAMASAVPPTTDPDAPLATRTPMATLPASLWNSSDGWRGPGPH